MLVNFTVNDYMTVGLELLLSQSAVKFIAWLRSTQIVPG